MGELQVQKASIDGERRIVVADLGPVRYLAMLLSADSETALRGSRGRRAAARPAAVPLLLAASAWR